MTDTPAALLQHIAAAVTKSKAVTSAADVAAFFMPPDETAGQPT
ncbi:MAG: hypothetical protein ABJZ55_22155 [Fuerstiella sp.]